MKKVLLPIKPRFVEQILAGDKKYEFRKKIWVDESVESILIYKSYPVKKVVADAKIKQIHYCPIDKLYEFRKTCPNPQERFFTEYFRGLDMGYAIEFSDIEIFAEPKELSYYNIKTAPQSFCYFNK